MKMDDSGVKNPIFGSTPIFKRWSRPVWTELFDLDANTSRNFC